MYKYVWRGCNSQGKACKGFIEAPSEKDAHEALFKQGFAVFRVRKRTWDILKSISDIFKNKEKDVALFFHHLSLLLESGVPLVSVLEIISEHVSSQRFEKTLKKILSQVRNGVFFADALEKEHIFFNPFMIAMVRAGERSGSIHSVAAMLAAYLEKKHTFEKKLQNAALMPVFTLLFACILITAILIYIIPQFETFFLSHTESLSYTTRTVFFISRMLRSDTMFFFILVFFAGIFFIRFLPKSDRFYETFDRLKNSVHPLGRLWDTLHYLQTIALLLKTGATLSEGLHQARGVVQSRYFYKKLCTITRSVEEGNSFSSALEQVGDRFFSKKICSLVEVGERTGNLSQMLDRTSTLLFNDINARVNMISSLIQPILILLVGGIVAFFIISIYGPIFSMAGSIV